MSVESGKIYLNPLFFTNIATSYMFFLNEAGQKNDRLFAVHVPGLFSKNFRKIVNGEERVANADQLVEYLFKAQEVYGKWKIHDNFEVYPSESTNSVTIKYVVETSKTKLLVIALLKLEVALEKMIIKEVVEVDHETR